MALSILACSYCGKNFLKENKYINENKKLGYRSYCSSKCKNTEKNKQVKLTCDNRNCNKKFKRAQNDVSVYNFCSRTCYGTLVSIRNKNGLNKVKESITNRHYCHYCGKRCTKGRKYCSNQCSAKSRQIPKTELIREIMLLYHQLQRTPTRRECKHSTVCIKYFGSWNNALITTGLTPHRSLNQKMYKRRLCLANDSHKCNSVSELIIDNWFYKNRVSHQKETSYPKGKFTADWSLSQQTFVEYFGLANDSRRYDEEIQKKRQICREFGINLIEIYSKDLFPKNLLERIFKSS